MKSIMLRIIRLFVGLFLYAVGVVMTINANLGLAPWDVFHQGIAINCDITIGKVSIIVGVALVLINIVLGERIGWGTLSNMIFIGVFVDLLMLNKLIPVFDEFTLSILLMILGMFVIGMASYYYIGAGLGSGPRDGLMIALTKKTKGSVRLVRGAIETGVFIIGYFLGGSVGIGTLVIALTIGIFVQLAFKMFRFDVSQVRHRFVDEDIQWFKMKFTHCDNINSKS